ncbi:MAG: alpha,6-mannosyltransferase [Solirubrobacteraceae bacterium]|jgi:hypothetical protein|nr:alpha,6-mannosyltransferase [Solirubrobacteraceae bacterium]
MSARASTLFSRRRAAEVTAKAASLASGAGRYALAVVVLVSGGAAAWRRRWTPRAIGIVLLASVGSLSWVIPWYLAWPLPFAALRTPRALAPLALVACLWHGLAGIPQLSSVVHDTGWYPTRSATGHANHEYEIGLVR